MSEWLSADEQRAWRAYRRMVLLVDSALARELARQSELSMPDYHVLAALSDAEGHRRRLTELAARMQWSPSRLSHHVTRMEQRGLVTRANCPDDLRGAHIVLSTHGWDAIREAAPAHVASVREHLVDLLSADEIAALTAIGEKVAAHFGEQCLDAPNGSTRPAPATPPGEPCLPVGAGQPVQSAKRSPLSRS